MTNIFCTVARYCPVHVPCFLQMEVSENTGSAQKRSLGTDLAHISPPKTVFYKISAHATLKPMGFVGKNKISDNQEHK